MLDSLNLIVLPLCAGLLVLASHVPLGGQVLRRGIIFIDLAVAQAAATGAMLATLVIGDEPWFRQGAALGAALLVTVLLHGFERVAPQRQEALIGGVYVVLTCLAVLVASHEHASDHADALLNGQLLWANGPMLIPLAVAAGITFVARHVGRHSLLVFYLPFAIAVTVSVQVVGVYLVFASLIFPALGAGAARRAKRWPAVAAIIGGLGYFAGLLTSLWLDLPAGPAVVLTLAAAASLVSGARHVIARRRSFGYNPGHSRKSQEHHA